MISQHITFLISLIVLFVVSLVLKLQPTKYMIGAIVPPINPTGYGTGNRIDIGYLSSVFRDLEYLWGVVLMIIMYCSAIFYEPSRVVKNGYGWILDINPLYSLIINFRNTVIYGQPFDMQALTYSIVFSVASLIIGVWMFYKNQDKFILNI